MLPHATTNQGNVLGCFRHGKNITDRQLRGMAVVKNRTFGNSSLHAQNVLWRDGSVSSSFLGYWIIDSKSSNNKGMGEKLRTSTTKCHPSIPITCPWPCVFKRLEPLVAETWAPSSRMWLRRWPLPHAAVLRHPRMVSLNQRLAMKSHLPKGGGTTLKARLLNKYDNIKVTILYFEMGMCI